MVSYFYKDMNNQDKALLASKMYGVKYQTLESWFRCLTDLRNRCAHYSRLYYWKFPALPKMPQKEKYIPTRRLFAQLYTLKLLYPDHEKWNEKFVKPLIKLMKKYDPYISKQHIDFPYRWKSMLTYKNAEKSCCIPANIMAGIQQIFEYNLKRRISTFGKFLFWYC